MAALAVPLITAGISGLAGLFGKKQQQSGFGQTESQVDNSESGSSSTTPNLSQQQQALINQLIAGYQSRISQGTDLSGYAGQGLRQINRSSNLTRKASDNILAARGLSNSPYAGFQDKVQQQQQGGQSADLLNSLPLLQRQMQGEDLTGLAKIFSMIPTGSTTTNSSQGSQHSNQFQKQTGTLSGGGGLGGFVGGLGTGLAAPNGSSGNSNLASILQSLGGIFGGKR